MKVITFNSLSSLFALSYKVCDPWKSHKESASPWSAKNGNSMEGILSSSFFTHSIHAAPHLQDAYAFQIILFVQ